MLHAYDCYVDTTIHSTQEYTVDNLPALRDVQVDTLISQAIDKQVPVEALEKLLAMRRELKLEYAQEQFNIAMASFQAECPIIKKTRTVSPGGKVAYRYAPIEAIVSQVKHLLLKYNFSYSVETLTHTAEGTVTAICTARHIAGHSQSSSFNVPLATRTALMTDTQVVAASLTFAKRYAFCNAFGILTGDDDNDARLEPVVSQPLPITEETIAQIGALLATTNVSVNIILKQNGVSDLKQLTQQRGEVIITQIKKYIENKQQPNS